MISDLSLRERRDELGAARHALDLLAAKELVELFDPRVRRVARDLLDAEVVVGDARDLRQVRDREHLSALGEPLQRRGDGVRGHAADAGVDLVEDERLATSNSSERESDARELSSRGGVGDRREREAWIRPDEERHVIGSGRPDFALP